MDNNTLVRTDLNDRYREIRARGNGLEYNAYDLIKILKVQGFTLERKIVEKELQDIQAQVTGIKLRYPEIISVASTSVHEDRRDDFQDQLQDNFIPTDKQLGVELNDPPWEIQHNIITSEANNIVRNPIRVSYAQPCNTIENINQRKDSVGRTMANEIRTATLPTPGQPITSIATIDSQTAVAREIGNLHNNPTSTFVLPATNTIHTHTRSHV